MFQVVNAVGSGDVDIQIDLSVLSEQLSSVEYNGSDYHGAFLRLSESQLVIIYRTGSYIIRGGDSINSLKSAKNEFLDILTELGVISDRDQVSFEIKNLVCTSELNRSVDLNTAIFSLGLNYAEYEPEQFPGLIYRPSEYESTVLLFSNGKMVITGEVDQDKIQSAISHLRDKLHCN